MSFLSSATTVVDAILTDEGRKRLAAGNFDVQKFSLHDDEIVYDKAQMASFAAKFAATPIFESITENTRALKYNLLTIGLETTHLVSTLIVTQPSQGGQAQATGDNTNYYVALSRQNAYDNNYSTVTLPTGFIKAYEKSLISENSNSWIYIDHGSNDDDQKGPYKYNENLPPDLSETEVLIKMDRRIGRIVRPNSGGIDLAPISIDDDFIATYLVTASPGSDTSEFFESIQQDADASPIAGARGLRLRIPVYASPDINVSSTNIWTSLGRTITSFFNGSDNAYAIDTIMTVEGLTTSLNVTVPMRFVKGV
jgi:hypothetical protein